MSTTSSPTVNVTTNHAHTDLDCLPDLAADALSAVRNALDCLHHLPDVAWEPLSSIPQRLRSLLSARSLLSDEQLLFLDDLVDQADLLDSGIPGVEGFQGACRRARSLAYRVRDLIEVEVDIRKRRGHRF